MSLYKKNKKYITYKILIFSILQFFALSIFAQFNTKEQMERELVYTNSDTLRLRLLIYLVDSTGNYSVWGPLNDRAYLIAKKLSTSDDERTRYLGKLFLADAINNKGFAHRSRGEIKETLEDYFECLKIREEIGFQSGIASSFNNLHIIFAEQGDTVKALDYLKKSLKIREEINDQHGIAQSLSNIGQLYLAEKNINAALFCLEKSISIYNNIEGKEGFSRALSNIGDIHFEQKQYEMARSNFEESLVLFKASDDKESIADAVLKIAGIDFKEKKYADSEKRTNEALRMAQNYQYTSIEGSCYDLLSKIFEQKGDTKKALVFYKKFIVIKQKINNVNTQNQLTKYQFQYEYAKKEAFSQAQQEQAKKDTKQQRMFYTILVGILAISVAILYYLNFLRSRANKNLEEKNKQVELALQRAEESEGYKSQFLSNMSHEIRTPMNAILGMSDLLSDTNLDKTQADYASAIRSSSENLLLIINDVLDFSKLEQGKMSLESNPFSLQKTINDIYNTMRFKAEEKSLNFTYHIDKEISNYLLGDSFRLFQVLINLIGNAIKFTNKGSITLFVEVVNYEYENDENISQSIKFSVQDTGIGIEKSKMEHIFESFQQATLDTSRRFGGTGLGLSISQQLVKLRGSKIEVNSELGVGSTFHFTIAYGICSHEDYLQSQGLERIKEPVRMKNISILLAEDNEYNRIVARESLQKIFINATIYEVENGQKMLDALNISEFDVILTDISMPEMDGYEAAKIIRSSFPKPKCDTPIIALTAFTGKEEEKRMYESGMNAHVYKPFKINDLVNTIVKCIGIFFEEKIPITLENKSKNGLVDLSFLRDFTENDKEQMQYFIQKFIDTIPNAVQQLDEAIAEENFEKIRKKAHNIKPQLEFVGILAAVRKVEEVENFAREKQNLEAIKNIFEAIKKLIDESILYFEKEHL